MSALEYKNLDDSSRDWSNRFEASLDRQARLAKMLEIIRTLEYCIRVLEEDFEANKKFAKSHLQKDGVENLDNVFANGKEATLEALKKLLDELQDPKEKLLVEAINNRAEIAQTPTMKENNEKNLRKLDALKDALSIFENRIRDYNLIDTTSLTELDREIRWFETIDRASPRKTVDEEFLYMRGLAYQVHGLQKLGLIKEDLDLSQITLKELMEGIQVLINYLGNSLGVRRLRIKKRVETLLSSSDDAKQLLEIMAVEEGLRSGVQVVLYKRRRGEPEET